MTIIIFKEISVRKFTEWTLLTCIKTNLTWWYLHSNFDQTLKPASKLSGWQQQRVAIARSLINDPKIIMGDEPTGNLDSNMQYLFKHLTTEFNQTALAVTHDNDFAKASDRIIEMADGIIL